MRGSARRPVLRFEPDDKGFYQITRITAPPSIIHHMVATERAWGPAGSMVDNAPVQPESVMSVVAHMPARPAPVRRAMHR